MIYLVRFRHCLNIKLFQIFVLNIIFETHENNAILFSYKIHRKYDFYFFMP